MAGHSEGSLQAREGNIARAFVYFKSNNREVILNEKKDTLYNRTPF